MNKNLMIICDSSLEIGEGHAVRCLHLANFFADNKWRVTWVFTSHTKRVLNLISSVRDITSFSISLFSELHTKVFTPYDSSKGLDFYQCIVIDGYQYPYELYENLYERTDCLLVFDDLANRKLKATVLVDASPVRMESDYQGLVSDDVDILLGINYLVMDRAYAKETDVGKDKENDIRKGLHIFFGSTDCGALTLPFVEYALKELKGIPLHVVVTSATHGLDELKDLCNKHNNLILYFEPNSLRESLLRCATAIGAPGTATWERLAMNVRSYLFSFNAEQEKILKKLEIKGFIRYLGKSEQALLSLDRYRKLEDMDSERHNSSHYKSIVDGLGCERIYRKVIEHTHKVTA